MMHESKSAQQANEVLKSQLTRMMARLDTRVNKIKSAIRVRQELNKRCDEVVRQGTIACLELKILQRDYFKYLASSIVQLDKQQQIWKEFNPVSILRSVAGNLAYFRRESPAVVAAATAEHKQNYPQQYFQDGVLNAKQAWSAYIRLGAKWDLLHLFRSRYQNAILARYRHERASGTLESLQADLQQLTNNKQIYQQSLHDLDKRPALVPLQQELAADLRALLSETKSSLQSMHRRSQGRLCAMPCFSKAKQIAVAQLLDQVIVLQTEQANADPRSIYKRMQRTLIDFRTAHCQAKANQSLVDLVKDTLVYLDNIRGCYPLLFMNEAQMKLSDSKVDGFSVKPGRAMP